jgi:hypothetical protein
MSEMDENNEQDLKNVTEAWHIKTLERMKNCLEIYEQIYVDKGGRNNAQYKFLKKHLMNVVYGMERDMFERLCSIGVLLRCSCGSDVKTGYKDDCVMCHGSGYVHAPEFNDLLRDIQPNQLP